MDFDGVPFSDVIQYLRDVTGAGIHVKWAELKVVDITPHTPVTLHLPDRTLNQVLKPMLEDLGDVSPLGFTVKDGVIVISTKDDLQTNTVVRVYDVQDLLVRVPDFAGPRVDVAEALGEDAEQVTGGHLAMEDNMDEGEEEELSRQDEIDALLEAIENTVAPESWTGEDASVEEQRGSLIIRQTPEAHRKLQLLLHRLREARADQYVEHGGPFGPSDYDEDRMVELHLRKMVGPISFTNVALVDVIQHLRDVTGAPIHVKWNALSPAGVTPESPVTIHLPDRPLKLVLALLLEDLGGVSLLSFTVTDGVIKISTGDDLRQVTSVRVYDVRPLLADVPGYSEEERVDMLIEIIENNVDPDSWTGVDASIEEQGKGLFVIVQTREGHQAIHLLLGQLREARGLEDPGASVTEADRQIAQYDQQQLKALPKRVGDLDVKDIPIVDVIRYLSDVSGAAIYVKWRSVRHAGITPDTPVTLDLPDRRLDQVLRLILEDLGDVSPLTFTVKDSVIKISTADDLRWRAGYVVVYDVGDLILPGRPMPDASTQDDEDAFYTRQETIDELIETIESNVDPESWTGTEASIESYHDFLVIRAMRRNHRAVRALLDRLHDARGPQVELGSRIAQQRAAEADHADLQSKTFTEFVYRNYDWRRTDPDAPPVEAQVARWAEDNLGQKVPVTSVNIGVPAKNARMLGVEFQWGENDVYYAVVDEAIVRTLRQQAATGRPGFAANPRNQETIVGTAALLSNDLIANVAYAQDRGNVLDVDDNPVNVPHDKYLLIVNPGSLTAIKAGPMQHWADPTVFEPLAEIPQAIDIPRVGRMIKFEKTLVDPADRLVLRARYRLNTDR